MLTLRPDLERLQLLCVGAHSDDIEIGCGGAVLELLQRYPGSEVTWVVLCGLGAREQEARKSARSLLRAAKRADVRVAKFPDGYFPSQYAQIKEFFESLKSAPRPDVIFTHYRDDLHQDHRVASELTWNTFRDHLILEYEIVKYDGGLGSPNVFVPVSPANVRRKVSHLMRHFGTQRAKRWFTEDTFRAMLRIRGIECNSPSGHAEAFYVRKVVL
ncbi:MAG: PIG-L family deacetylase [Steroidobacteraceae bacterium]|nr:PIG-L family deacetylase [Steroidobacteraceae bacterium]